MIIWSGLGFLPLVFCGVFALVFPLEEPHGPALVFFAGGVASSLAGWPLRKPSFRESTQRSTGQRVTVKTSHTLFFIPILYWGPLLWLMGLVLLMEA